VTKSRAQSEAGFTLLEAMAGVAAMGAIVAALSLMAAQWMPAWRHGFADLQRAELLGMALDRITADLAAAEYVTLDASTQSPAFEGLPNSARFVRSAIGPNASPGLEFVQIAETSDGRDFGVVRSSAPFTPGNTRPLFGNPVVLTHAPFRISFAYAGLDRTWVETWTQNPRLPNAIRITVRDAKSGVVLAVSTAALMKVTAPPPPPEVAATGAAGAANQAGAPDAPAQGGNPSGPAPPAQGGNP
jgi:general secretion pathway protein J